MSYVIHINPASRSAVIRITGTVDGAEVMAMCRELFTHPDWAPGFSMIWDASDLRTLVLLPEDIDKFAAEAGEFVELRGPSRSAVVATDLDVKMSALLLGMKSQGTPSRSLRMFDDIAAAEAWLAQEADAGAE